MKYIENKSPKKLFWLSFVFYVTFSLIIVYGFGTIFGISQTMGGSQHDGFLELARNLASGNGYVFEPGGNYVIHRPPAYVFFLLPGMYLPNGIQRLYVIFLNSFFAAGIVLVLKRFSMQLSENNRLSGFAVMMFMTNPWIIWAVKNPMAVIFQTFFYLLMTYIAVLIFTVKLEKRRFHFYALSSIFGVICGIASLSHGVMLPVSLLLILLITFLSIKKKETYKVFSLALSLIIMISIVGSWTIRNYFVTRQFIPVVGNTGVTYFGGNAYWGITKPSIQKGENIFMAILRHADVTLPHQDVFHYWGMKNYDIERQINQKMVNHVKTYPLSFGKKICLNAIGYYFPIAYHLIVRPDPLEKKPVSEKKLLNINNVEAWLISLYHVAVLLLATCAIINSKKSYVGKFGIRVLVLASSIYAIPYFPFLTFVGHSHYVFGTLPFLYILSSDFCLNTYDYSLRRLNERNK